MMRQYLTAKFRPGDKRAYTYHNDGPPVAIGDEVKLPSTRGTDGWVRGTVFGFVTEAEAKQLPFQTKAILGLADPKPADLLAETATHEVRAIPGGVETTGPAGGGGTGQAVSWPGSRPVSDEDFRAPFYDKGVGEWRPSQPGDAIPTSGMFEVQYRAELDPPRAPETMPADQINWQHVSRFRSAPDAPAAAPGTGPTIEVSPVDRPAAVR